MGVEKTITVEGSGAEVKTGHNVTVHCTGQVVNEDGSLKKFWSTRDPDQTTFKFQIGQGAVIKAWDEGCLGMKVGESATLVCTPDYGYGAGGFPAWGIPPSATLQFDVEVVKVE